LTALEIRASRHRFGPEIRYCTIHGKEEVARVRAAAGALETEFDERLEAEQ
jgi:hypothetical protein